MIEHGVFMDDLPIIIHMLMIYLFILEGLPFTISDFSFDSNPTWCLRGKRGHGGKGSCPQLGCDGLTVDGCENHGQNPILPLFAVFHRLS